MNDEQRAKALAELRASYGPAPIPWPQYGLFPPPVLSLDAPNPYWHYAKAYEFSAKRFERALAVWHSLAIQFRDRPNLEHLHSLILNAWLLDAGRNLLGVDRCDKPLGYIRTFTSVAESREWARIARESILLFAGKGGVHAQFFRLSRPVTSLSAGAAILPGGLVFVTQETPVDWLRHHFGPELWWPEFLQVSQCLLKPEPLTAEETQVLSRLAIRLANPGDGVVADRWFAHASNVMRDVMRHPEMIGASPAAAPPIPTSAPPEHATINNVHQEFDRFENYLRDVEERREAAKPKPPVDVNVVNRVDARMVDVTPELEERLRAPATNFRPTPRQAKILKLLAEFDSTMTSSAIEGEFALKGVNPGSSATIKKDIENLENNHFLHRPLAKNGRPGRSGVQLTPLARRWLEEKNKAKP